jgi:hypothetical protein
VLLGKADGRHIFTAKQMAAHSGQSVRSLLRQHIAVYGNILRYPKKVLRIAGMAGNVI